MKPQDFLGKMCCRALEMLVLVLKHKQLRPPTTYAFKNLKPLKARQALCSFILILHFFLTDEGFL